MSFWTIPYQVWILFIKIRLHFALSNFLENKKQLVLTHNTDLIRLLDVQLNNCFNLYIMNNILDGTNGFISVSEKEKKLLINLHDLVSFFQNKNNELVDNIHNRRHFLMAMVPFMRGYAHISLDSDDRYTNFRESCMGMELIIAWMFFPFTIRFLEIYLMVKK